ncbi:conserved protein of unknown function (plasmid) [Cupriavidus taiwanensis]|uniref:Acyl-CoA dehydrogenase/oxidase N-terminal domain-containing protein n=1 Tax=Cupriavidus taiwanensis TaxID=164546 RepID=A0A375IPG3_9BURK|nr:acyl-CoA dehydrogenase family protein [Cupriavidus taiwanensis]SPK75988.1 conserved protein of unknown function [Cupriavidus taiwanensis]
MNFLNVALTAWLAGNAEELDSHAGNALEVLPRLAEAGLLKIGVPASLGGDGRAVAAAVDCIAQVAEYSQTAAFVLWAQRTFVEYVLQSRSPALQDRCLADLLEGRIAGATGLSNAMKYLGGTESLQIVVKENSRGWTASGNVPWATNLHPAGFLLAVAAINTDSGRPGVYVIPFPTAGLHRNADLDLIGLRSSNTASAKLESVAILREWLIAEDALTFLPRVRPAFLGLQCALAIGLATRSLAEARRKSRAHTVLASDIENLELQLRRTRAQMLEGLASGRFSREARELFAIRIELSETATAAVQVELRARGGVAYMTDRNEGFARRLREAAFLPIVTPSLAQIREELAQSSTSGNVPEPIGAI